MGAFGDKFRNERERRGFTLDDVSNVTKISPRMLQAIEEEDFEQLPGGVFNKGFVRAYARHLGFNDSQAVTEYLAALREAQISAQAQWDPGHGQGIRTTRAATEPAHRATNLSASNSVAATSAKANLPSAKSEEGVALPSSAAPAPLASASSAPDSSAPEPERDADQADARRHNQTHSDPFLQLPIAPHLASQEGLPVAGPVPGSPEARKVSRSPIARIRRRPAYARTPSSSNTGWKVTAICVVLLIGVVVLRARHSRSAQGAGPASAIAATPAGASLRPDSNAALRSLSSETRVSSPASEKSVSLESGEDFPATNDGERFKRNKIEDKNYLTNPVEPNERRTGASGIAPIERTPDKTSAVMKAPVKAASPITSTPANSKTGSEARLRIEEKHYGSDVTVRHFSPLPPPAATAKSAAPFTLVIRATQNCWISVTADGQLINHETLIAPAQLSLRASREVTVKVGNAAAVNFLLNGSAIPANGFKSEVKTFTFDHGGIRPSSGTQ